MLLRKTSGLLLLVVSVAFASQLFISCRNPQDQADELRLADASVVWWMGPGIIADKQGLYKKNGLEVNSFDVQTGLASKNAVLAGSADIGLVATAPLATGAFSKENLIVLCSYVESQHLLSVITPKSNDDLEFSKPTPPVAIVKGTISEFYYYKYMSKYFPNEDVKSINQLNVKPPDITTSMKNGDAKSAVIWEPFGTMIASSDSSLKVNRSAEVYTHRIYIITTPDVLKKKRSAVEKFVKSFEEASNLLKNDPKAKETIKNTFPPQEQSMNELWNQVDFSLKYDYDKMKTLILEDADILFNLGLTPKDNSGNPRRLNVEDVQYYFSHDFKLPN